MIAQWRKKTQEMQDLVRIRLLVHSPSIVLTCCARCALFVGGRQDDLAERKQRENHKRLQNTLREQVVRLLWSIQRWSRPDVC